jgi:hypothetical protein
MDVRKLIGDTAGTRAWDVGQLFGSQWVKEHEVHAIIEAPGVGKRVTRGRHSTVITAWMRAGFCNLQLEVLRGLIKLHGRRTTGAVCD